MSGEPIFEIEEQRNRSTIAATLRSVADQLEEDGEVTLSGGGETVTVSLPEAPRFELEVEQVDDEFELEIELGWSDGEVDAGGSKGTFELYEDAADEWRWRLRHDNGNVIADSGEGYTTRANAENGIESVRANAPGAEIERVD